MRHILSLEFTLTKRHLGLILLAAGLLMILATVAAEWLRPGGFGTVQKMGAAVGVMSTLVGITLLPLGNQPA
jgi:hypothetical protein